MIMNHLKIKRNLKWIIPILISVMLPQVISADGVFSTIAQSSQTSKVTGKITDNMGEPLVGATIQITGSTRGVIADENGDYEFDNVPVNTKLSIAYIGMETKEVIYNGEKVLNIVLESKMNELDDIVVVAFGKQKKESVVASITTVRPSDLKVPSSNLTTALAGKMAGLIAYQRSGEPGLDNADFFIRGVTTFGYKKDPLILIDNNESTSSELARLQPDDIASFSIMKDATAVALYGSRGANGVISVTTKTGEEGPAKFFVRYEEGFSSPTKLPKIADHVTYMNLHNEAVRTRNALGIIPYSPTKISNTLDPNRNPYVYPVTDWYNMLFKDFANNRHLNFSGQGGGTVARYYIAGSYINDNGTLQVDKRNNFNSNVSLNRYTLRVNVNINMTKTTEMIARLSGAFDNYRGPRNGGADVFTQVMNSNPVMFPAYYAPDENYKYIEHILFGNATSATGSTPIYNNPYAGMVSGYKEYNESQINMQFELRQKLDFITEGLNLRAMFNTSNYGYFDISRAYTPYYYSVSRYEKATDKYLLQRISQGTDWLTFLEGPKKLNTAIYFESALNWARTYKEHDLGALLVYTMREYKSTQDQGGMNLQKSLPKRNIGLAGRLTYGYDARYLAEFNFGYNGSERFSKKERFGFFPSAGVGWVISNEAFWGDLQRIINNLKVKATFGLAGNDAIGSDDTRFFFLSDVTMSPSFVLPFGTWANVSAYPGTTINRYANDMITWETAKKTNLMLEVGLLKSFEFQGEIYYEKRENILMDRSSIPTTMGLEGEVPKANVGEAESRGIDLSLSYNHFFKNDFWMQAMANFTYAKSKFLVYEEPIYPDAPWKSHIGYSINQNYGYIAERLFIDDDDIRNSPTQFGNYLAGDIKYMDLNGDGKITELDQAPIGYPTSPEIVYGFGASLGYKAFDLSFFFQGLARESFWIEVSSVSPFVGGQRAILREFADSHWSEENRNEYAVWPRLSTEVITNNNQTSTWFMRDGSFLRLKQLELGYTLPSSLIKKIKMNNLRFYLSGTNLLTFSKFKLWDPEMVGKGYGYPVQRVLNVGINLNF